LTSIPTKTALRASALTVVLAGVLAVSTALPASAHDGLVKSSPEAGSTVTAEVTSVDLEFSEDFLDLGTSTAAFAVQVQGPDEKFYNLGCVALNGAKISTQAALGESGEYTVLWQVVSSDGHPTSDTFTFTYEKPEGVDVAEGAMTGASCNTGEGTAPPVAAAEEPPSDAVHWIVVLSILAVIVIGIVVLVVVTRSRRKTAE